MSRDTHRGRRTSGAGGTVVAAAAAGCLLAAGLALTGCSSAASSAASSASSTATTTPASSASAAATTSAAATPSSGSGGSLTSVPFPVAAGNTWKFNTTVGSETGTAVNTMTSVVPASGGQQVTMSSTNTIVGTTTTNKSTYLFESDGSIVYPLSQINTGSDVSVSGSGIVWPPASVIDSGTPSTSSLNLSIKTDGQTFNTTAHITVQGAGTQTVTVPAGTYQATIVNMTEAISLEGVSVTLVVKTWLAPGVGPVKDEVITTEAGASHVTATEELTSFTKG